MTTHTLLEKIPVTDRINIMRVVRDGDHIHRLSKIQAQRVKKFWTPSTQYPHTPRTIGMWQRHGSKVYQVDQIMPAVLGRLAIPFTSREEETFWGITRDGFEKRKESHVVRTIEIDGWWENADWTPFDDPAALNRAFSKVIENEGKPEGCLTISFGGYGKGLEFSRVTVGNGADLAASRLVSITLRWHPDHIRGWEGDQTRIQLSCEWGRGTQPQVGFLCVGIGDDGSQQIVTVDGQTAYASEEDADGKLDPLSFIAWAISVEVITGLFTKRIVERSPSRPKRSKGSRSRTSTTSAVKTCYLDVPLWSRYVRRSSLRLIRGDGGSTSPRGPYEGPGYVVGAYTRRMWVLEKNVRPDEAWLDIRESASGKTLVLVARECNEAGYTIGRLPNVSLQVVKPRT